MIEKLLYPVEEKIIKAPYSDCKSFSRRLKTYTLEEILTEKLCALIGRTEPRDLYDTHFLLDLGQLDYQSVAFFFPQKAKYKRINPKRLATILALTLTWNHLTTAGKQKITPCPTLRPGFLRQAQDRQGRKGKLRELFESALDKAMKGN